MEIKFRANDHLTIDYLRHLFNAPASGPIRLSLANDFGRMAVGLYKVSDTPIGKPDDELTVTLVLPRHQTTYAAMTRYVFFTEADTKRLNMILDALFNIDLDTYYLQGIQAGMPKRDIIEAFVVSRISCRPTMPRRWVNEPTGHHSPPSVAKPTLSIERRVIISARYSHPNLRKSNRIHI